MVRGGNRFDGNRLLFRNRRDVRRLFLHDMGDLVDLRDGIRVGFPVLLQPVGNAGELFHLLIEGLDERCDACELFVRFLYLSDGLLAFHLLPLREAEGILDLRRILRDDAADLLRRLQDAENGIG